jgi:putative FmdB family regulatory protein
MPLYEYFCEHCDGIFEDLRSIRESSEPAPCPLCDRDARRIMPTSFAAFTFRDGIPRSIPDRGTYWHLGKEVKKPISGEGVAWEHPEVDKPKPPRTLTKGERQDVTDYERLKERHVQELKDAGEPLPLGRDGKPSVRVPGVQEPRLPED